MSADYTPSAQEIQTARELGYVTQAGINGIGADRIDSAVDTYRTQFGERNTRLEGMHEAITKNKSASAPTAQPAS